MTAAAVDVEMDVQWPSQLARDVDTAFKCKYITTSKPLGDGNFSIVKECMNIETKELYAMKLIHKHIVRDKLQLIQREFALLKTLSQQIRNIELQNESKNNENGSVGLNSFQGHHHVLQLFDFFETTENIVLITQLCDRDDLYEKITSSGHLDLKKQVVPYTACLISVLEFLHSQGLIHRDIKAENVLFRINKLPNDSNTPTPPREGEPHYDLTAHDLILADFGLAIDKQDCTAMSLKEYVGTISYISPQIVRCKGIGSMDKDQIDSIDAYDESVDIWALGVLAYFMAFGYTPFDCETDEETLDCIAKCDYYIDEELINDSEYNAFWNFIQCCFVVDQTKRKSAKSLKLHPFVRDHFLGENNPQLASAIDTPRKPMRRNKSFTSLHNLRKPPSRRTSSSILTKISSTASLQELLKQQQLQLQQLPNTGGNNSSLHQPVQEVTISTSTTTPPPPVQAPLGQATSLRDANLAKIKDTLRRTLSMTSMEPSPTTATLSSSSSTNKFTRSNATNSTFFLDPQPPKNTLMNGAFSETPESMSNFNTTPRSSLSLSRSSSYNNTVNVNSNALQDNSNNNPTSTSTGAAKAKEAHFDLNFDDDDEEEEEED